jgi:hypothetical protein
VVDPTVGPQYPRFPLVAKLVDIVGSADMVSQRHETWLLHVGY